MFQIFGNLYICKYVNIFIALIHLFELVESVPFCQKQDLCGIFGRNILLREGVLANLDLKQFDQKNSSLPSLTSPCIS